MAASWPPLPCVPVKSLYGPGFHDRRTPGSVRSAEIIMPMLIHQFEPVSVVDVGCGVGAWLSVVEAHGGIAVMGVDGPWVSMDDFALAEDCFVECDLGSQTRASTEGSTCASALRWQNICRLNARGPLSRCSADWRTSSCSRLPFPGREAWAMSTSSGSRTGRGSFAERIRSARFGASSDWDNDDVDAWYRQNLLVFVRDAEDDVAMMDVVHPVFVERGLDGKKRASLAGGVP